MGPSISSCQCLEPLILVLSHKLWELDQDISHEFSLRRLVKGLRDRKQT
jgi:hypothetical protein